MAATAAAFDSAKATLAIRWNAELEVEKMCVFVAAFIYLFSYDREEEEASGASLFTNGEILFLAACLFGMQFITHFFLVYILELFFKIPMLGQRGRFMSWGLVVKACVYSFMVCAMACCIEMSSMMKAASRLGFGGCSWGRFRKEGEGVRVRVVQ